MRRLRAVAGESASQPLARIGQLTSLGAHEPKLDGGVVPNREDALSWQRLTSLAASKLEGVSTAPACQTPSCLSRG